MYISQKGDMCITILGILFEICYCNQKQGFHHAINVSIQNASDQLYMYKNYLSEQPITDYSNIYISPNFNHALAL